jgi:drug/metabolite transporter (DMT)-like permease
MSASSFSSDLMDSPATLAADLSARSRGNRLKLVLALAAVWIIWGSTYLAMRFAVAALPPFLMGGTRFVLAGTTLLLIVRLRGETMPKLRTWLVAIPVGALLFLCGNGLASFRGERPRRAELVGMVLGLLGVGLLGIGSPLVASGWRAMLVLFAPVGWALGSLIARAEAAKAGASTRGLGSAGAHMIAGGVWMLLTSVVLGEHMPQHVEWQSVASWIYLVFCGSLVGFSAYSWLLANSRPSVAMSYAYVNPIIAVLLGAVLGGEGLGWATLAATALIGGGVMAAVVIGQRAGRSA